MEVLVQVGTKVLSPKPKLKPKWKSLPVQIFEEKATVDLGRPLLFVTNAFPRDHLKCDPDLYFLLPPNGSGLLLILSTISLL
jgi:hypothetical protein